MLDIKLKNYNLKQIHFQNKLKIRSKNMKLKIQNCLNNLIKVSKCRKNLTKNINLNTKLDQLQIFLNLIKPTSIE